MKSLKFYVIALLLGSLSLYLFNYLNKDTAPKYEFKIVNTYNLGDQKFTQGLIFYGDYIYISTGLYGKSSLIKFHLDDAKIIIEKNLDDSFFAEGLALFKNRLYQLTWKNQIGFIYEPDNLIPAGIFNYEGEGWGLTANEKYLIMSDGTSMLKFIDPVLFNVDKNLIVRDGNKKIEKLNELEFIRGKIWANVWKTNLIAIINSETGKVEGWLNLAELRKDLKNYEISDLNGIAYDSKTDRIFVTGKNWPLLFEISVDGLPLGDRP